MKNCALLRNLLFSVCCVIINVCLLFSQVVFAVNETPPVSAQNGAILMEADTGTVLFEQNADTIAPMASTTKIMSALLALESEKLDDSFVVDSNAIQVEGSSMGLQPGDQVTMRDLCYGMLLPSGNDAANAAAVKISGSIDQFVSMMNEKAKQLGMTHTVFATPSGLDDNCEHHSSARDMAILAQAAMKNANFREIAGSKNKRLSFGNPPYDRTLYNHNKLLSMYSGTTGIKTGFTDKAGRCLISSAERNGVNLIAVVLKDSADWNDSMALFDYGFSKVHMVVLPNDFSNLALPVAGGNALTVDVTVCAIPTAALTDEQQQAVQTKIKTDPFYYAPIHQGDVMGKVEYTLNENVIGSADLCASSDIAMEQTTVVPIGFNESVHSFIVGYNTLLKLFLHNTTKTG